MIQFHAPKSLYAAFDLFPSAKGAATHIDRFAPVLFNHYNSGLLYVLGNRELPKYQQEKHWEIYRFTEEIPNFLNRTVTYGQELCEILDQVGSSLKVAHFRDPWSGIPIVTFPDRTYKTVYEINGLPSIELPTLYPALSESTLQKIHEREQLCIEESDAIITPSVTIKENLIALGTPAEKITVIANGAEPDSTMQPRPTDAPEHYLIYVGALQAWQGINTLLRAFSRLQDLRNLKLVICASTKRRTMKQYVKFAEKLGISESIIWLERLPKAELKQWLYHSTLSLAPLAECARNINQGCCPLKILESMALAVPVIASDLPVVREIITHGENGYLVRPDRPSDLARAVRLALEYPTQRKAIAQEGFATIKSNFTWGVAEEKLRALYNSLNTKEISSASMYH